MDAMCKSILRYLVSACLSGPCGDFNNFVKSIKGNIDSGIDPHANIIFSQFGLAACNKYLNMVASKEYNKVYVRKQELLALTTKIEGLEARLRENMVLATSGGSCGGTNAASGLDLSLIPGTSIEHWRITKQGASLATDGKNYCWCEKHVDPAGQ